jgi:uncharacterized protein
MLKKIALTFSILMFALIAQTSAQTDGATQIAPEKQAAIKELIGLINSDNKAEQMLAAFETQVDEMQAATISSILDERKDLTEAERKTVRGEIAAKQVEYAKQFREKMWQKLNFGQMMEEISTIVYDKYYTIEEIKDLIVFYKTPTGQKAIKTSPSLMADTLKLTFERMIPKITVIMEELKHEQKMELEKEVNLRKPRAKKVGFN